MEEVTFKFTVKKEHSPQIEHFGLFPQNVQSLGKDVHCPFLKNVLTRYTIEFDFSSCN